MGRPSSLKEISLDIPIISPSLIIENKIFDIKDKKSKDYYSIMLSASSKNKLCRIFNIRFQGPKVWNSLDKNVKSTSKRKFKENLKRELLSKY